MRHPLNRRVGGRPSRSRRVGRALLLALAALSIGPAAAFAHPLGNFTINHFAGIRISTDRVALDVVIDRAEIPTFQERQQLDTDGDGTVSPAEIEAARQVACQALSSDLWLTVAGERAQLNVTEAGLSFPPGAGGLSTMRLVCEYTTAVATQASARTAVAFEDRTFAERIGWREIVVLGDGVTLTGAPAGSDPAGVSKRLTTYPTELLAQPLDRRSMSVSAVAGGPALPAWTAPDASVLRVDGATKPATANATSTGSAVGAVPGGVAPELAAIIDAGGLQPGVLFVSLLVALGLGAAHAVSPGHGKTIMAAYLVGTRGTARHALGLGLTVTVAHTLGVLALAGVTLLAADVLPPDRLYPILQVASGGLVIAIGGRLLVSHATAGGPTATRRHRAPVPACPGGTCSRSGCRAGSSPRPPRSSSCWDRSRPATSPTASSSFSPSGSGWPSSWAGSGSRWFGPRVSSSGCPGAGRSVAWPARCSSRPPASSSSSESCSRARP